MRELYSKFYKGAAIAAWAILAPHGALAFNPQDTIGLYGAGDMTDAESMSQPQMSLTRAYIPDAVDLSPMMPTPVQQINGSCVAFSIGYATRGYYSMLESGAREAIAPMPSPAHLHTLIRQPNVPCEVAGSRAIDAYAALRAGATDRRTFPDSETCKSAEYYSGPLDPKFRIVGHDFLYIRRRDGALTTRHLDLIKQQLAAGHPVPISMRLYFPPGVTPAPGAPQHEMIAELRGDEIYRGSAGPHGPGLRAGHAMVAVGYDDRREAVLVQNSWGTGWAGSGYGWFGYDALRNDLKTASVMRTNVIPPRPIPGISGTVNELATVTDERIDPCSSLRRVSDVFGPKLVGHVASSADRARLAADFNVTEVDVRPYPVCEALKTLEEPLLSPIRPQVRMLGGSTDVRFGQSLAFEVTTPNVPSFLYLIYIDAEGTAINLTPRRGVMRQQHAPNTQLVFGDGGPGRLTFTAVPPSGDEAIIAIAARSPLSELEALETGEMLYKMPIINRQATRGLTLIGVDDEDEPADDRFFLSALKRDLLARPNPGALPREIGATVLHIKIGD
ncbi:MAG: DUF4384 domain-containing protein [Pseudomonadota bacterium]